jgi:hypothetical protein
MTNIFPVRKGLDAVPRLSMILWGLAGVGKTTWAATAPGEKLWLSFGDSEHMSVIHRSDVSVMELFRVSHTDIFRHGIGPDPFNIGTYLQEHKEIETVVVDSITVMQQAALEKAVDDKVGQSRNFTPTLQVPGLGAFGGRNQNLLQLMKSILMVTARFDVHCIMTAHEEDPSMKMINGIESVERINMSLGGKLVNLVSSRVSEIWNMRLESSRKRQRIITTRPSGYRHPMKTRMFSQKGEAAFTLTYDADKADEGQMTIADFYYKWVEGGCMRLPVPSNRIGGDAEDNVDIVIPPPKKV